MQVMQCFSIWRRTKVERNNFEKSIKIYLCWICIYFIAFIFFHIFQYQPERIFGLYGMIGCIIFPPIIFLPILLIRNVKNKIIKFLYVGWIIFWATLSVYGYLYALYSDKNPTGLILMFVLGIPYPLVPFFITYCAKYLFKKSKILFVLFLILVLCFYGFFSLKFFYDNDYRLIIIGWIFLQILSLV